MQDQQTQKHFKAWLLSAVLVGCAGSHASQLTYSPVNPNFGGNPLNGGYLLNNAQAQNDKKDPSASSSGYQAPSALDRFTSSLESRLLNQLLTDVGSGNSGSLVTDDFIVNIVDDSGSITINITDKSTNETTEIEVGGLNPNN